MIQETKFMNEQMYIYISGSIYIEEATEMRENFIYLINKGHKMFVVDLAQVDYIDSTGLGMLVFAVFWLLGMQFSAGSFCPLPAPFCFFSFLLLEGPGGTLPFEEL